MVVETAVRRAGIYTRISSDPNYTEAGVERQREDCERLVRQRDWELVREYRDNDRSAFDKARPEYERLLADIRAGRINAVVSWHSDRVHRSLTELEAFIKVVEAHGVAVEAVTSGTLDLSTPSGRAMARTMTTMARFEVEHRSERIRRKAEEIAKSGRPAGGGIRAFGLAAGDWTNVIEPERALIEEAANRILRGESLGSIVSDWRRRGVKTPGRSTAPEGRFWTVSSLKRMLVAPRIAGDREHRGVIVGTGVIAPMLDRATWERVRDVLAAPRGVAPPTVRKYMLTGLAYCGICGTKLSPDTNAKAGKSSRRYSCRRGAQGCGRLRVLAKHLEGLVAEAILHRLDSPAFRAVMESQQERAGHESDARQLRIDEASMSELASDFYVRHIIDKTTFLTTRKVLEARIEASRRALAASTADSALDEIANMDLRAEWAKHEDDAAWKNWVCRTLVDRVIVAPAPTSRPRFDPARVSIVWRA